MVKLVFAPKYRNTDDIEAQWLDRSNPKSSNWGSWFSLDDLVTRYAPTAATMASLHSQLNANGATQVSLLRKNVSEAEAVVCYDG
jgi:hypothetical protein